MLRAGPWGLLVLIQPPNFGSNSNIDDKKIGELLLPFRLVYNLFEAEVPREVVERESLDVFMLPLSRLVGRETPISPS